MSDADATSSVGVERWTLGPSSCANGELGVDTDSRETKGNEKKREHDAKRSKDCWIETRNILPPSIPSSPYFSETSGLATVLQTNSIKIRGDCEAPKGGHIELLRTEPLSQACFAWGYPSEGFTTCRLPRQYSVFRTMVLWADRYVVQWKGAYECIKPVPLEVRRRHLAPATRNSARENLSGVSDMNCSRYTQRTQLLRLQILDLRDAGGFAEIAEVKARTGRRDSQ